MDPSDNIHSSEAMPTGAETILFVDDEKSIRRLGQTILERHGYTVILAQDGPEGVEIFKRERGRIGLVILDITMPERSGPDVFLEMRAIDPKMKIIISSGHAVSEGGEGPKGIHPNGYVPKPYRTADLLQIVRNVLDGG